MPTILYIESHLLCFHLIKSYQYIAFLLKSMSPHRKSSPWKHCTLLYILYVLWNFPSSKPARGWFNCFKPLRATRDGAAISVPYKFPTVRGCSTPSGWRTYPLYERWGLTDYIEARVGTYLEQQERVSFRRKVRLGLGLVRPIDDQRSVLVERRGDFLCE